MLFRSDLDLKWPCAFHSLLPLGFHLAFEVGLGVDLDLRCATTASPSPFAVRDSSPSREDPTHSPLLPPPASPRVFHPTNRPRMPSPTSLPTRKTNRFASCKRSSAVVRDRSVRAGWGEDAQRTMLLEVEGQGRLLENARRTKRGAVGAAKVGAAWGWLASCYWHGDGATLVIPAR